MVFEWKNSTQQFGGNCSWTMDDTCEMIGPHCAAFAEHPECMIGGDAANQPLLIPETGAKQLIQSFGAVKAKFLSVEDQEHKGDRRF